MKKPTSELNADEISKMFNELEQCVRCLRLGPKDLLIKKQVGTHHWFYCDCCYADLHEDKIWGEQFKKGPVV